MSQSGLCALLAGVACSALWATEVHAQTVSTPIGNQQSPEAQTDVPDAATDPSDPTNSLQTADIVVTAQKREQSLRDVPMSITAISGADLVSRGVKDVQDLAKVTPGLSFVESGTSVPVFSLRGVGFFDTALGARPTISIYLDEAPIPFSIEASGAAFDLERVEVLKGPQGTLFGQNATGGAINYIAAKPTSAPQAGGTISFERFNTADLQGYVSGPVAKDVMMRVALRGVIGGDVQRSYTRDAGLGQQAFFQGRVQIEAQPTSALRINLNVNGFVDNGEPQAGQLLAIIPTQPTKLSQFPLVSTYPLSPLDNRAADWGPGTPFKRNRFGQAILRGDLDVSDNLTLTSLTTYSYMKVHQFVDLDGTALNNSSFDIRGRLRSFSQELRLTGDYGIAHFILGGNYARDRSTEDDFVSFDYSTLSAALQPFATNARHVGNYSQQTFKTKAAFANLDLDLTKWLILHGGVRYTQADLDYRACSYLTNSDAATGFNGLYAVLRTRAGLPPLTPLQVGQCYSFNPGINPGYRVGELNEDNVAWRTGIDLKPAPGVLIYANVSRGYKAGSIPSVSATANDQLAPVTQESVLAYEAGFKLGLLDGVMDVTGAAFLYKYTNKQLKGRFLSNPNIFGPLEGLVNVPRSEVKGLEGQVTVTPVTGLRLTASGTYIYSKITGAFTNYTILGTSEDFQGEAFPYTPKWQVVVDGEYRFPVNDKMSVSVGGNYSYRSSTTGGFGTSPLLRIDGYGLLDLRAGLQGTNGDWSLQVFGRNVTNQYYWTNVAKYVDVVRRLAGRPATYGIQFTRKFR